MQACIATSYSSNVAAVYCYSLKNMQISIVLVFYSKPVWNLMNSAEDAKATKAVYLNHSISAIRLTSSCVCG